MSIKTLFKENIDTLKTYLNILVLRKYAKPFLKSIALVLLLNTLISILGMINPLLTQALIDRVYPQREWFLFYIIIAIYLSIFISSIILGTVTSYKQTKIQEKMTFNLMIDMQKSCSKATYGFFSKRQAGEYAYRFSSDAGTIVGFYAEFLPQIVITIIQLIVFLIISINLNSSLTCIYLSLLPVKIVLEILKSNRSRPLQHLRQQINQDINNFFVQFHKGILTVKVFLKEKFEEKRLVKLLGDRIRLVFKQWRIGTTYDLFKSFFGGTWEAVVLFYGWYMAINGQISLGTLVALQLYLTKLAGPIGLLIKSINMLMLGSVATERIMETLNSEAEESLQNSLPAPSYRSASTDRQLHSPLKGAIEFKHIFFGYRKGNQVLKDINFKVAPGTFVGITGPSGVGKTTLTNLLIKIFRPDSGSIYLDGIDIESMPIKELREQLSVVQQEIFLFNGTIMDNILYGNKQATRLDALNASQAAAAHDFIVNLPEGYDTIFGGKAGINLSQGQKQRIALARALIRNAPILILDEFTTALDVRTDVDVFTNIKNNFSHKTIFLISHKVAHLLNTDYTIVLYQGGIKEMDSPGTLLKKPSLFRDLYEIQYQIGNFGLEKEYGVLEQELGVSPAK
jgi:ATP-binding cassette subfamily B protein